MKLITVPQKKRGRPATGESPRIGVRLPVDVRESLERYAGDSHSGNNSEAIRAILSEWLDQKGYFNADG